MSISVPTTHVPALDFVNAFPVSSNSVVNGGSYTQMPSSHDFDERFFAAFRFA
jgi:hypothetical protein